MFGDYIPAQKMKRQREMIGGISYGYAPPMKKRNTVKPEKVAGKVGEMKYFDTALSGLSFAVPVVTTTWPAGAMADPVTFNTLCCPQVGAAINQRIGRQIHIHKIKIQGYINIPGQSAQNAADNSSCIRLILVQDNQTNGTQMTAAQLLADNSAADTTIHSYQNLSNFGRFRVLKDKKITVSDMTLTGSPTAGDVVQSGFKRAFKMNVTFKNPVSVRFNATNGGTIADIVDNSFHVICAADNIALAPTLAYSCRVCYKE